MEGSFYHMPLLSAATQTQQLQIHHGQMALCRGGAVLSSVSPCPRLPVYIEATI